AAVFLCIVGGGEGLIRAELHDDDHSAASAAGILGGFDVVALYRAVIARGAPILEEILEGVAPRGLPELIGAWGVSGHQRIEKAFDRPLLGIEAEHVPDRERNEQGERQATDDPSAQFRLRLFARGIEQTHQYFPLRAGV